MIGRVLAGIAGLLVLGATTSSVIRTLVVPRALRSRLAATVQRLVGRGYGAVAARMSDLARRDQLLSWAGPVTVLATFATWLVGCLIGFGLLVEAVAHRGITADALEAGSSLFSLGQAGGTGGSAVVDYLAAATGPLLVGLQVGYLPTLYAAYNRREVEVTRLEARAGDPPWGPELLARQAAVDTLDNLRALFEQWERWAADVSESHTNYPVLLRFRSPHPLRDWLVAMLAVADAAALQLALSPSRPQGEARLAVRGIFVCLRALAASERIPYDPDPDPDAGIELPYAEFAAACAYLADIGYPVERTAEEAWPHFRGWRVNYEAIGYHLAHRFDAPPALWSGPRRGHPAALEPSRPVNRQPGGITGRPKLRQSRSGAAAEQRRDARD